MPTTCVRSKLRLALESAILAPSGHNAQPWKFRLSDHEVEIWADRSRRLPVIDPEDRELVISCGAALLNLRVALEAQGERVRTQLVPRPEEPDLLARAWLAEGPLARAEVDHLAPAIKQRHTYRAPFLEREIESEPLWAMQEAACAEGCRLVPLTGFVRDHAIALIGEVDARLCLDPLYRQALQDWLDSHTQGVIEGIEAVLLDEFATSQPRLLARLSGGGQTSGPRDQRLARTAPLLALLTAPGDGPYHWMLAGQAMQRVLLEGARFGLQASFLNQPLEIPEARESLARWTSGGIPQLMLRFGYPAQVLRSPGRRPLEDVLSELP